jgi:methionine sulfoxide reductase heme-binding subunit
LKKIRTFFARIDKTNRDSDRYIKEKIFVNKIMNALNSNFLPQKWNIVGFSAIAIATILAIIFIFNGINEEAMRIAIRATARTSCILFASAFIASSVRKFWSNQISTWLQKNRRYLGLSFAVSHTFHALAIIGLAIVTPHTAVTTDHGGNLGYLFIFAMTATSFDRTAKLLSPNAWKILHTVGMYYLWLALTYAFSMRIIDGKSWLIYAPFITLLILAMILRLVSQMRSRSKEGNRQ